MLCVQSMVQVETLGELGVFFNLFVVGLEFSPERLRKVPPVPSCRRPSVVYHLSCTIYYVRVPSIMNPTTGARLTWSAAALLLNLNL